MNTSKKVAAPGIAVLMVIITGLLGFNSLRADSEPVLAYKWSGKQKEQMELAIRERDSSLLPRCTNDYYEWRERTKEARKKLQGDEPPSLDFWSAPGCWDYPLESFEGPPGGPVPDHIEKYKWHMGYATSRDEIIYSEGSYSEMEITDVGVDHSTVSDFFASRVLALGINGVSIEAGWVEAAFWDDTDQHIYAQNSNYCAIPGVQCTWNNYDHICDNTRDDAQIAIAAISETNWRSSCWDGNSWNKMHDNVSLGDDIAYRLEVVGEIRRTTPEEMDLTSIGVYFRANEVRDHIAWTEWTTEIDTFVWGDDDPYRLDDTDHYEEFYIRNNLS